MPNQNMSPIEYSVFPISEPFTTHGWGDPSSSLQPFALAIAAAISGAQPD